MKRDAEREFLLSLPSLPSLLSLVSLFPNGFVFCSQHGFDTMVNFTGACGADESSYLDCDSATIRWAYRSSGGKDGCYPLFGSITCE